MSKSNAPLSNIKRKARKLKRTPVQFFADSKLYVGAYKTFVSTWARLGSFCLVIAASIVVVMYYSFFASPRYVSEVQFVVKQSGNNELPLSGFASLGAVSPTMRDALILKRYIHSRDMAYLLNQFVGLKSHYESTQWDWFSRLETNSSAEDYVDYYKEHVSIHYDETSEIIHVEVQSFSPDFSLEVAGSLLDLSEDFINKLGRRVIEQQLEYAKEDVAHSYSELKRHKSELIKFQDRFELYDPKTKGSALEHVINKLEAELVTEETSLNSLLTFMQEDSSEVIVKKARLNALNEQLEKERSRLTKENQQSLNKISVNFQEIELNATLAVELYKSSLSSLERLRGEAYKKLKYLLVVDKPALAEEDKYPRRVYSIFTWFVSLLLFYVVGKLVLAIVREHQE